METLTSTITYRGYLIQPVFDYDNGKHDFQVYKEDSEHGSIEPYKTVAQMKAEIDEKID